MKKKKKSIKSNYMYSFVTRKQAIHVISWFTREKMASWSPPTVQTT